MSCKHEKTAPLLAQEDGLEIAGYEFNCVDYTTITAKLQAEVAEKFEPKKKDSELLSEVYKELGFDSKAMRVHGCGTFLEYAITPESKRLQMANFCKDRLCPMCNWRRSLKIFGQVSKVMDYLEADGYVFLFLTLTVKNCSEEDLPKTVQMLYDGWRYLYNKCPQVKKVVQGTFRSLEVTRNAKAGSFHPHLHCILAVRKDYFNGKNYIPQKIWSELWSKACGLDYNPIIDVRRIKPQKDDNGEWSLSKAVAEASKYAVKSADFLRGSMEDKSRYVRSFLESLAGRRLCDFTGVFRSARKVLELDDIESGDLVHVEEDALRADVKAVLVRYHWKAGFYERSFANE